MLNTEHSKSQTVVLLGILLLAAALRFYQIDFGKPFTYHPDEIKLISQAGRLLDSHFMEKSVYFAIGTYPPFFTYMLAGAMGLYVGVGLLTGHFDSLIAVKTAYQSDPFQFFLVGRVLSAMLGIAVVLLLFLIGRRLYSKSVGLLAALLAAVNMALINHAHFSTVDTAAAFWGLLCAYYCLKIADEGSTLDYILAALFAALATATKFNMALLVLPIIFAHFSRVSWREWLKQLFNARLMVAGLSWIVGFLLACPILWLDFRETIGGIIGTGKFENVGKIGSGGSFLSYWTGDQSDGFGVFFPNSIPDTFGILLTGLCALSIFYLIFRHKKADLFLLIFLLPMYFLFEKMSIKAIRHLVPIIPFLLLAGAVLISEIHQKRKRFRVINLTLVLVIILTNMIQVSSYWWKIAQLDPRTRAHAWVLANISPQSLILEEDFPPILPGKESGEKEGGYSVVSIRLTSKSINLIEDVKEFLKTEGKLYYIADGFSRQTFDWKYTRQKYPEITRDRKQLFDWLDRNGKMLNKFESANPRLQPEIIIYELAGKRE
jgi:4-amino-4-deoxy-L-arabinose transferase-like glycosyltransferase